MLNFENIFEKNKKHLILHFTAKQTYPYVVAGQYVVKPFVEIAISRQTYIVKHWTTTQDC